MLRQAQHKLSTQLPQFHPSDLTGLIFENTHPPISGGDLNVEFLFKKGNA
jgi:hypothetical protein